MKNFMYYALAHDLVEIYVSSVICFESDVRIRKEEREKEDFDRIKKKLYFSSLIEHIEQYEVRQDFESKFIYVLDKIIAPLNIINHEGFARKKS